jgi:hypothetical protein
MADAPLIERRRYPRRAEAASVETRAMPVETTDPVASLESFRPLPASHLANIEFSRRPGAEME